LPSKYSFSYLISHDTLDDPEDLTFVWSDMTNIHTPIQCIQFLAPDNIFDSSRMRAYVRTLVAKGWQIFFRTSQMPPRKRRRHSNLLNIIIWDFTY